jgi:hypothetical protein
MDWGMVSGCRMLACREEVLGSDYRVMVVEVVAAVVV